jgi:hypothetical protein
MEMPTLPVPSDQWFRMFDALACRREVSRRASPGAAAFVAIDVAFGKGGQLAVRGLLLPQILFEQAGATRAPQELGLRCQIRSD